MSSIRRFRAQRGCRLSQIPRCHWCGDPIKISSRRPRAFCGDRCRQAAHRRELRDRMEVSGPDTKGQFRDSTKSVDPRTVEARITHLLGSGAHWRGGVALDRATVAKIIRSELGGGISEVTSTDGVKSTVIKAGRADTCLPTATISRNTPQPTRPVAVEGTGDAINVAASD
jgi:hypothetical protein